MAWNLGGLLLPHFLEMAESGVYQRMIDRVMRELTTTFAIAYTQEIGRGDLLDPQVLARGVAKATSEKLLVCPSA